MGEVALDNQFVARFHRGGPLLVAPATDAVRLSVAVRRVAPSWVEAVAVTQAVCARLARFEMPPTVGDLVLHASGHVSFPPGGIADEDVAIQAVARLLARLTGDVGCPLEVWDAFERAQVAPMTFGSARGFGASLKCVPEERSRDYLAAYMREVQDAGR